MMLRRVESVMQTRRLSLAPSSWLAPRRLVYPADGAGPGQAGWDTARVWTDFEEALQRPERGFGSTSPGPNGRNLTTGCAGSASSANSSSTATGLTPCPIGSANSTLERLSLQANRIRTIPFPFWLTELRDLNLADNEVQGIPEDIDALVHLERLILWSNMIGHYPFPEPAEHLVELDLLHNEMSVDEQTWVQELLPNATLHFSEPCRCRFDD